MHVRRQSNSSKCQSAPLSPSSFYKQQEAALRALYNSTGGPMKWQRNWEEEFRNNCTVCEWHGVHCDAAQQVTSLKLLENKLTGPIPSEIGNLKQLVSLRLSGNFRGTIPESLYTLSNLRVLELWGYRDIMQLTGKVSQLTGTISEAVQGLIQLAILILAGNKLQGTIPAGLSKLTHLKWLFVSDNFLLGSIPESLHMLRQLRFLDAGRNLLRGTIPTSLCNISELRFIYLYQNSLSGTLPTCLGVMPALSDLSVFHNLLSGTISHGWKTPHRLLDLGKNQFDGTLPSMLPSTLTFLGLGNNKFHGSIPHTLLASMNQLEILFLSRNLFTGRIPLVNSSNLIWMLCNGNGFNGPVLWASLLSPKLEVLSLANNQLSGSIAPQLPRTLERLLLNNNQFSGALPSFELLSNLETLTVHENQCHGKLHLPQNASSLWEVFAHNNGGLSCPVSVGGDANAGRFPRYLEKRNLMLAGNRFSSPVPKWAAMHDASAMYVASELRQWTERIAYVVFGLPLLLCCVLAIHRKAVLEFFVFEPAPGLEYFQWWSARAIGVMGVPFLLVLLPLYAEGANLYECGEAWLKTTTIAYLSDSPVIEWCVAAMACVAAVAQSCLLMATRHVVDANFPLADETQSAIWLNQRCSYVIIVLVWLLALVICSAPIALYALSTALPTDNTLGLSETTLDLFNEAAVVLLYLLVVIVSPIAAGWLVRKVTKITEPNAYLTTRMVLVTRLTVGVLVPTALVFLFSNDCMSFWLYLWTPCVDDASSFDVEVPLLPVGHAKGWQVLAYVEKFANNYTVTTHNQICHPTWKPQTSCSRDILSTVGNLMLSKAIFVAFFTPGAVMLMSLPVMTRTAERIWNKFYPGEAFTWYRGDVELSFILMFFEYTFIFGFIMPLILPFMVVGLLMNCAVYRCCVRTLELPTHSAGQPSFAYLYAARVIGMAYLIYFFIENELNGQLLVCIGMPVCAIVGDCVAYRVWVPASLQRKGTTPATQVALDQLRNSTLSEAAMKESATVDQAIISENPLTRDEEVIQQVISSGQMVGQDAVVQV